MPNRIIKESICSSADIDKLKPFEETVFYRLIVNCDDYGRLDARMEFLKSKLFVTKRGITEKNIEDAILQMASIGLVRLYKVDGKPFLLFPKWELHQQIRAKKSKYPAPDENGNQMISDDIKCPRNTIQSESNTKKQCAAKPHEVSSFFESIWALYPYKKGKGRISEAKRKALFEHGYDVIAKCISRYLADLKKDEWRNPQNGSTFFNSGYIDYLDENYSKKTPDEKGKLKELETIKGDKDAWKF